MFGIGLSKIFGGAAVITGIVALVFWGLWNSEKVKSKELENRLELSIANTETLKTALKDNSDQMKALIKLQAKNMEMINEQQDKIDKIDMARNAALNENRKLRLDERLKALQNPFKRGNAASGRVRNLMRGIAGRGSSGSSQDSNTTETNNPE